MSDTRTHTYTKQTHYVVQRHGDRDRLTDAQWDKREDTLDLKPWLSRQEVGRKTKIHRNAVQIKEEVGFFCFFFFLFGRVESGGVASSNLTVLRGWVGG